jgi:hypothetical protein
MGLSGGESPGRREVSGMTTVTFTAKGTDMVWMVIRNATTDQVESAKTIAGFEGAILDVTVQESG